jgi:hypothetical protein
MPYLLFAVYEVLQNFQPVVLAFFRVELSSADFVFTNDSSEFFDIFATADGA